MDNNHKASATRHLGMLRIGGVVCLLAIAAAQSRADIIVLEPPDAPFPMRALRSKAIVVVDPNTFTDKLTVLTQAGGLFDNDAFALAVDDDFHGTAAADANQTTMIPDLGSSATSMSGTGGVFGSGFTDGLASSSYQARSLFDVFFEVNVSRDYEISGYVNYAEPFGDNTGYTVLRLFAGATDLIPMQYVDSSSFGFQPFSFSVSLLPGTVYRLVAEGYTAGSIGVEGLSFASGDWSFNLKEAGAVPEPTSFILLLAGIPALGILATRRYKNV